MNIEDKALEIGTLLFLKYKIIKILGKGNYSFVYLVEMNCEEEKHYVVKEFYPHEFLNREKNGNTFLKKTLTPAKIDEYYNLKSIFQYESNNLKHINKTNHTGIIELISFHNNINNTDYIVTNYTKTMPLQTYLETLYSPKLLIKLLKELLIILEHIHQYSIFHQDIKVDNILIKEDTTPLIIDFGSSVILHNKITGKYLNTSSVDSAAIEQLSLNYPPEINESTDIYSLALIFYKVLTGKYPVNSKTRECHVTNGKNDPYTPLVRMNLPCFNKSTLLAIDKALNLYSEDRYASASEFRLALEPKGLINYLLNFIKK